VKPITKTLDSIDSLITDWEDWESEDQKPDPRAKQLRDEFNALRPLLQHAPVLIGLLRDARGTMSSMRTQIDQMSGMFDDEDGAIEQACEDHDDLDAGIGFVLKGIDHPTEKLPNPAAMQSLIQGAVDKWGEAVDTDEHIDGGDAVQWLTDFIIAAMPLLPPQVPPSHQALAQDNHPTPVGGPQP